MAGSGLQLNKWYLDFVGDNGETMIFYAARLSWKGLAVQYGSWIHYDPQRGVEEKSHFRNVHFPEKTDRTITWSDVEYDVSGRWECMATPLQARIFESDQGCLDWHCYQPASTVQLKIKDKVLNGNGYVEELVLTALPWHIPMNELRWGRFRSAQDTLVWIELRQAAKQQWLWLNGERIADGSIEDDRIASDEQGFVLTLDRSVSLESGQKIFQVMRNLFRYLPGFKQLMPMKFLMSDNYKWVSKGELQKKGSHVAPGRAIHEWVNFNVREP